MEPEPAELQPWARLRGLAIDLGPLRRHPAFRRLFVTRLSAAAEMRGLRYSRLIHGLHLAGIGLDRKQPSQTALGIAGWKRALDLATDS